MTTIEVNAEEVYKLKAQMRGAASWFFWIAGLSLVNLVSGMLGHAWTFVFGLGVTQVLQGIAFGLSIELPEAAPIITAVAYLFIAGAVALFALFGYLSRKGQQWAFIVGAAMYAADTVLFLLSGEMYGVIFHLVVLLVLFGGVRALRRLRAIDAGEIQVVESIAPPPKVQRDRRYWLRLLAPALIVLVPLVFFLIMFFVMGD